MIEHKIGEVFENEGVNLKVKLGILEKPCVGCYYLRKPCNVLLANGKIESCAPDDRQDGNDVIFVEVK